MNREHTSPAAGTGGPAADLQRALGGAGLSCDVDAVDRLVVLRFDPLAGHEPVATKTARQRIIALARAHGFTHVAVELESPVGAAVHRGQS